MKKTPINKFELRRLSEDDGGGWLITFPELPGCTSDGDSIEEAIENGTEAEEAWLAANEKWDGGKSGKLNIRIPKSVHAMLTVRAKEENVSINTLIISYLSVAVNKRSA